MEPTFWHKRWEHNEIGFHEEDGNPLLVKHFQALSLAKGDRVFVPLCGKTRDIHWVLQNGYRVAGAELSPIAVKQLFDELGLKPNISEEGPLHRYRADNLDIFVGDLFDLTRERLGRVDAIYDRAALVALPEDMRRRYASHLAAITGNAPQLLICFEYDQRQLEGPPFSIRKEELNILYTGNYELTFLEGVDVPGGLKGKCAAKENVWLVSKRQGIPS
jgi:thiopurine S-methyltransferase